MLIFKYKIKIFYLVSYAKNVKKTFIINGQAFFWPIKFLILYICFNFGKILLGSFQFWGNIYINLYIENNDDL